MRKIILLLSSLTLLPTVYALAPDGMHDQLFGFEGFTTISTGGASTIITDIAIQNDDKIIICGAQTTGLIGPFTFNMYLARFNSDGTLDTTFANQGILIENRFVTNSSAINDPIRIAIKPDGRIITAATNQRIDIFINSYLSNGQPDNTFGDNGLVSVDLGTVFDRVVGLAITREGDILIAANAQTTPKLIKLSSHGSLDQTFGVNGIATPGLPGGITFSDIEIMHDGKIAVGGSSPDQLFLSRFNQNGTLDTTFGTNSGYILVTIPSVLMLAGSCLTIQPDDKFIIGGQGNIFGGIAILVARCTPEGLLDTSFGSRGIATYFVQAGMFSGASDIALQSDEKIVLTGFNNTSALTFRLLPNGILDQSFGTSGTVLSRLANSTTNSNFAIAIDSHNRLVWAGQSLTSGRTVGRLERVHCQSVHTTTNTPLWKSYYNQNIQ